MSPAEVTEKLGLHRMRDRSWYVHPRYVTLALVIGASLNVMHQLCDNWRGSFRGSPMAFAERKEATGLSVTTSRRAVRVAVY